MLKRLRVEFPLKQGRIVRIRIFIHHLVLSKFGLPLAGSGFFQGIKSGKSSNSPVTLEDGALLRLDAPRMFS
jgi:hypothetical protein